MSDEPLVLYDALNSPAGRRVRITLLEKNLRAEVHWLNLALMEQKRPEFLCINPNGTVPALCHADETIFESAVICEYLDSIGTGPCLVPQDTRLERTRAPTVVLPRPTTPPTAAGAASPTAPRTPPRRR